MMNRTRKRVDGGTPGTLHKLRDAELSAVGRTKTTMSVDWHGGLPSPCGSPMTPEYSRPPPQAQFSSAERGNPNGGWKCPITPSSRPTVREGNSSGGRGCAKKRKPPAARQQKYIPGRRGRRPNSQEGRRGVGNSQSPPGKFLNKKRGYDFEGGRGGLKKTALRRGSVCGQRKTAPGTIATSYAIPVM